ncbi:MAG TPA: helix-turn-helix domain-containing protein, partial [Gammaproteobacteria bacterium]|nr:helix-turn-helix domain-containing protein [Gammaproteobacteria bacterium]
PYSLSPVRQELAAERPQASVVPIAAVADHGVPTDFRAAVADFEKQVLRRALERAQFKQTVAAKVLGLSYHQFRSLLRKHGLVKQGAENGD